MTRLLWNVSDDLSIWHSSLTSVLEYVSETLELPYILSNFINHDSMQLLALADNPQFYPNLPASLTEYQSTCKMFPVYIAKDFRDTNLTIYVLTNSANRVVIEREKDWRTFDNGWRTNGDTFILRSSCLAFLLLS